MQATATINNLVLKIGSTGALVKELQQLLNLHGYKLTLDGIFGLATQEAVKSYQRTFHNHLPSELPVTGIVDHQTCHLIYHYTCIETPNAMPILRVGSTGEAVQLIQDILTRYFVPGVIVDGDFGAVTEAAVKQFQKTHNLVMDGIFGSKTWQAISPTVKFDEVD